MQLMIPALCELLLGNLDAQRGVLDMVASTIEIKQSCPLCPTLFGLYINDISEYIRGILYMIL